MWDDDYPLLPDIRVNDHLSHDTGLLDAKGEKITRPPRPIGFHRPKPRK